MRKFLISAAALAAASIAAPSSAAVFVDFTGGASVLTTPGLIVVNDFSTATGITGSNYVIHVGSPNDYDGAAPAFGDHTDYLAVKKEGTATVTLPATNFFAFDIGSADTYNTLTIFYTIGGVEFSKEWVPVAPANGNQVLADTNGLITVWATEGEVFTKVTFASSQSSFEVDNLAVPEASTWAMMLVGLGAVGFAMRRQKVSVSFA